MLTTARPVGDYLREWRGRRRLSQLDLALEAEISTRHLSFLETGRAQPSREMILRLSEQLEVPLRERNRLLAAAGFAPIFPERRLDDPALAPAKAAVERLLAAHEPFPAIAIDRHWTLVASNGALAPMLAGVDPALLQGEVNVLRVSLHPQGMAPHIVNLSEWRAHVFERLRHQIEVSADPVLEALLAELRAYPEGEGAPEPANDLSGVVVPLRIRAGEQVLSFLTTTTVFGTPVDVTLSELALETFFPADEATAAALRGA